ncbi:MAG: hypothetical protein KC620_00155, partial [Myxococcales bacterium]|nr:hypothetical protein [Myxococcales bacterium]
MRRFAAPLLCLSLLAAFEIGVARDERIWSAAPRTASGVFAVLEAQVIEPAEAPQVVLLGSSRVRDAVPPRALEAALGLPRGAVLNLGLTSGTPLDALTLYRRHRDKLGRARVLLLGVEDWYLNGAMPPTDRERRFATWAERVGDYVGEVRL